MMNTKLLKGSLDTILLKLLSDHKEMYGYEIAQKVENLTHGELKITEGALYPALHRLEAKGLVNAEIRNIGNRMRKYYHLTKLGKKESLQEIERIQSFIQNLTILLAPKLA